MPGRFGGRGRWRRTCKGYAHRTGPPILAFFYDAARARARRDQPHTTTKMTAPAASAAATKTNIAGSSCSQILSQNGYGELETDVRAHRTPPLASAFSDTDGESFFG